MFKEVVYLPGSQEIEINSFINEYHSNSSEYTFFTSGSTGTPKKLIFSKDQLAISAKKSITYFELNETHTFYLCLDIKTVAARMLIVRAYLCGARLVCGPVKKEFVLPKKERIDFISLVPIQLQYLLQKNYEALRKSKILIGGTSISNQLVNDIVSLDLNCYQSFGMTETLSHVALRKITLPASPYEALTNISFSVSDHRLIIHYPELQDVPIVTNDEIVLIDNQHFHWKGRRDFVVNSGGIKLHPAAIEDSIMENLGLKTLLFGIPDPELGEKLVMLVQKENLVDLNKSDFSFLLTHEIPKLYQCIDFFYFLPNEKMDRKKTQLAFKENEWRTLL
jgi:O-succinylbenzoic acid--CoA ligase